MTDTWKGNDYQAIWWDEADKWDGKIDCPARGPGRATVKVVRKPYEIEAMGPMTLENRDEMIAWVESKGWNVHKGGHPNPDNYFWVGDDDHPPVVKQGYYVIYDPVREGVEVLWPSEFLEEYVAVQEPS